MIVIKILFWIAFLIQMICFSATLNEDIRRRYGRVFNTSINTDIYHKVFYGCAITVLALFAVMNLVGV